MGVSSKDIQKARQMAKRNRSALACAQCKTAKSKCSDYRPCKHCVVMKVPCQEVFAKKGNPFQTTYPKSSEAVQNKYLNTTARAQIQMCEAYQSCTRSKTIDKDLDAYTCLDTAFLAAQGYLHCHQPIIYDCKNVLNRVQPVKSNYLRSDGYLAVASRPDSLSYLPPAVAALLRYGNMDLRSTSNFWSPIFPQLQSASSMPLPTPPVAFHQFQP